MKRVIGKHDARRAAAKEEPSPITALRDLLAISLAADVAAVAPMVCDVLRDQAIVEKNPARRKAQRLALQQIEGQGGALALDVARAYRERFTTRLTQQDPMARTQPIDDLSIMDDSKLQRVMALDSCAARLREQCAIEIFHLSARLSEMLGRPSLADSGNPILPRLFCRCLTQGFKDLGMRGEQRFEAFMAFSPALLHIVPDLYSHANALLVERNVLANFSAQYGRPVTRTTARAPEPKMQIPKDPKALAELLERLLAGSNGGRGRTSLAL